MKGTVLHLTHHQNEVQQLHKELQFAVKTKDQMQYENQKILEEKSNYKIEMQTTKNENEQFRNEKSSQQKKKVIRFSA
jgi:hypothetical protein